MPPETLPSLLDANMQKFFGSFFQKRTERKHFFFEKKKQKTFTLGSWG
jgi:hypothetical protein